MIGGPTQISIEREMRWSGAARAHKVHIDGVRVGEVRAGRSATFDVVPGRHRVKVTFDWTASEELVVDCAEGEVTRIRADQRTGAAGVLGSLTSPKSYLTLELLQGTVPVIAPAAPAPPMPQPPPPSAPVPTSSPATPAMPAGQAVLQGVALDGPVRRAPGVSERIEVPTGVTVQIKRSRTFERSVELKGAADASLGISVKILGEIKTGIRGEVLRNSRASETIEYEIALDGANAEAYELTWVDVWRGGTATVGFGESNLEQVFELRETTELAVEAINPRPPKPSN